MEDDFDGGADPLEPRTQLVLADYTWLPAEHQLAFQQTLEQDEGVALCYFLAECQRLQKREVVDVIVLVSSDALYLCSPAADIFRCVLLEDMRDVLVCDEWLCFVLPNSYDLAFRFTERNNSRHIAQRPFLEIINKLRMLGSYPPAHITTVASQYALTSRQLTRPALFTEAKPLPIPILSYDTLRSGIANANKMIDVLTFQHRLKCPRQNRATTRAAADRGEVAVERPLPDEKFSFSFVSPKQQRQIPSQAAEAKSNPRVQPPAPIAASPESRPAAPRTAPHARLAGRVGRQNDGSSYMDPTSMASKLPYDPSDFVSSAAAQTNPMEATAVARKLDARLSSPTTGHGGMPRKSPARVGGAQAAVSPAPGSRFKSPTASSKRKERAETPTAPSSVANMSALSQVPSSLFLSQILRTSSSPKKEKKQNAAHSDQRPTSPLASPRGHAAGLDTSQRIAGRVLTELEEQRRSIENLSRQIEFLMAKTRRATDASPPSRRVQPSPTSPRVQGSVDAAALPRPGSFSDPRGSASQMPPMTSFQRNLAHMSFEGVLNGPKATVGDLPMHMSELTELVRGDSNHHHENSTAASRIKRSAPANPAAAKRREKSSWATRW